MKRTSGGQLSLGANATLLSSHAGGPRAAAGDTSFAGQAKQSTQASRVSLPPAREPTGQAGRHRPSHKDDDSDRRLSIFGRCCRGSSNALATRHAVETVGITGKQHPDRGGGAVPPPRGAGGAASGVRGRPGSRCRAQIRERGRRGLRAMYHLPNPSACPKNRALASLVSGQAGEATP